MKTVVIIQARMGSKRLPGKVMMDIHGKPMLARVIERCQMIVGVDQVACTFPAEAASKSIFEVAQEYGVACFYGNESDVLGRYFMAAVRMQADIIVRITADCPLIDPLICARVIELRVREHAEYASNCHPRSFQKGLDCEVFTYEALHKAHAGTFDDYDREHVTPYIVRNNARVNLPSGLFDVADINWSVDTLEDLERVRSIYGNMEKAA